MMNPLEVSRNTQSQKSSALTPILVGCGAFVVGIGLTVGYVQWQAQQQQLAQMSEMLMQMQTRSETPQTQPQAQPQIQPQPQQAVLTQPVQPAAPAPAPTNEAVTRNAPVDLLSVAPAPAPAPQTPEATPAAATAPVDDVARTTADRIRALVSRSSDPLVSAAIAQDVARRETMSIAIQGVNELVTSAVAGRYDITTEKQGGKDRLRISFPDNRDDQLQLERLLSSAAGAGMIAYSDAVKGSDGSFDGRIILFDLVERALLNGSETERNIGQKIREEAVALLSNAPAPATTTTQATGQRIYTVEAGDSLAYIALQFYGNTNDYLKIFRANSDKLSSPEKIQIGQQLIIPSA